LLRELSNIEKSSRMSKSDLQAQAECHRERDSIEDCPMIDGHGIARYTLCYGLNADEMARWSPRSWTGSLRTA
jgi:hypothetical protein